LGGGGGKEGLGGTDGGTDGGKLGGGGLGEMCVYTFHGDDSKVKVTSRMSFCAILESSY
jgi:hypothetical protein